MGQTLSHGVYLPAEGERNCYSGLASNWNLLDTAIGDTAGKASATHTHGNISNDGKVGTTANLPLITGTGGAVQAGSFGNSANTFCEGNDSRLSDARTPTSHVHGNITNDGKLATANRVLITDGNKVISLSGVTDTELSYLSGVTSAIQTQLNAKANDSGVVHTTGNETVGGVKTFSSLIKQSDAFSGDYTDVYQLVDSNNYRIVSLRATKGTASNTLGIYVHDQNNSAPKGLIIGNDLSNNVTIVGSGTNNYLGTSTNKWKSVYSDSYYYGTTAWGLDKSNVWSGDNSFTYPQLTLKNSNITRGTTPNTNRNYVLSFTDSNNDNVGMIFQQVRAGSGSYKMTFSLNNGTTDHRFNFYGYTDGSSELIPEVSGVTNLGTSEYKWKSFNGVNPGALSLPVNNDARISVDTTNWAFDGSEIQYTPTLNGYLNIRIDDIAGSYIVVNQSNKHVSITGTGAISISYGLGAFIPLLAGTQANIRVDRKTGTRISVYLYPCLGNV